MMIIYIYYTYIYMMQPVTKYFAQVDDRIKLNMTDKIND